MICAFFATIRPLHIERVLDEIALTAQQVGRTGADRKRLTMPEMRLGVFQLLLVGRSK